MREVNFSIPSANKACVSISTALYDRRALDCTSNLPLINSLNNLAYLTTSSGRIRDILTVDGGIERLVCILKEGRSKDMMEMWKWNLAFQCIVNIGVRGSETVRRRVVEADMVPVIATILDNYIQVIEKCRERADIENKRKGTLSPLGSTRGSRSIPSAHRSRRNIPPPIAIPDQQDDAELTPTTHTAPQLSLSSPPERTSFAPRSAARLTRFAGSPGVGPSRQDPPLSAVPLQSNIRPVRDVDRLPSMLPTLHVELSSQPQSPTTPNPIPTTSRPQRPAIRHQLSMTGDETADEPEEQQPDVVMQDIVDEEAILAVPEVSTNEDETFNITHRTSTDGSAATVTPTQGQPAQLPVLDALHTTPQPAWRQPFDRPAPASILAAMPRDEDVLMSLQLLAYVSKYCGLRSYFQQTHLVPRLKIGKELNLLDPDYDAKAVPAEDSEDEWDCEFVKKPGEVPYNIFPLIERFTSSRSSSRASSTPQQGDMQYWAGVVMRNLCRKDDNRGGVRQCANWQCGKWEETARQFAKCRRCRRTKYCSKTCQKSAWGSHRFWCVAANEDANGEGGHHSTRHHHHHTTHHHHH